VPAEGIEPPRPAYEARPLPLRISRRDARTVRARNREDSPRTGASGEIRTPTERVLNPLSLPLDYEGMSVDDAPEEIRTPTWQGLNLLSPPSDHKGIGERQDERSGGIG
jgi:hypothetical protein